MAFLETPRFPECISMDSVGGPGWSTDVIVVTSGAERRNANWSNARYVYDVSYGIKSPSDIREIINMFQVSQGRAHGFRYKDYQDFNTASDHNPSNVTHNDEVIGTGDGSETEFQLVKNYTSGSSFYARKIFKPVPGTVLIGLDAVNTPESGNWSVDTTTGIVTFTSAPGVGVTISAGFQFDVPVRFDSDELRISNVTESLQTTQIPLVEIRI